MTGHPGRGIEWLDDWGEGNPTILATNVSFEEYMEKYAAYFMEWVDGNVIQMAPVHKDHVALSIFLSALLLTYMEMSGEGVVVRAPMVMRPGSDFPAREPDLQVITTDQREILQDTLVAGSPALVVEIISPESGVRDCGKKFIEYERAGIREYWIIDPIRREAVFYQLNTKGFYKRLGIENGFITSGVLSRLRFQVDLLW